ncbi:hypothetical protein HQ520_12620, partial [bacterium]|nr:hypothetical protein [bacterium]
MTMNRDDKNRLIESLLGKLEGQVWRGSRTTPLSPRNEREPAAREKVDPKAAQAIESDTTPVSSFADLYPDAQMIYASGESRAWKLRREIPLDGTPHATGAHCPRCVDFATAAPELAEVFSPKTSFRGIETDRLVALDVETTGLSEGAGVYA